MKTKPMIFNSEMVRALLDGRKLQTRRPVKCASELTDFTKTPVDIDDLIYVRETFVGPLFDQDAPYPENGYTSKYCEYKADNNQCTGYVDIDGDLHCAWKPSIHMPRWASRLTLKVTGVRVERVQDISNADCIAEGFTGGHGSIPGYMYSATPKEHFSDTWKSIYGDSWERNDLVWVIDFEVIRQNVDECLKKKVAK